MFVVALSDSISPSIDPNMEDSTDDIDDIESLLTYIRPLLPSNSFNEKSIMVNIITFERRMQHFFARNIENNNENDIEFHPFLWLKWVFQWKDPIHRNKEYLTAHAS